MITEITNDNYTTQEKLQILADAAKYDVACTVLAAPHTFLSVILKNLMSHVLQAAPADAERKESSAMQKHVASVTVLPLMEDVFPFSRS